MKAMKSSTDHPLTPKMIRALWMLCDGESLRTGVGQPTKQRLAKYGLATFDRSGDWDGPMHVTDAGVDALKHRIRRAKQT